MRLINTRYHQAVISKAIFLFIAFLFYSITLNSQCTGGSQIGTNQIPCSGSTNSVNNIGIGNYILVYVINGVNYNFSSNRNGITLVNDLTNNQVGHTTNNSISYTSNFSGSLRVYNCSTASSTLTYSATNLGSNIQDNQNNCGSNSWVIHFFDIKDNATNPPSNSDAFSSYIGYNTLNETLNESFGGNNNCFPALSNGSNTINVWTETFAAKLCNQSIRNQGAYIISALNDNDGCRLTVDGTLIMNRWDNQGPHNNSNILFSHTGNSSLLLEYFENNGANTLEFGTITRVNNVLNSNTTQTLCQGGTNLQIGGTNTLTDAPVSSSSGYSVTYQWQVSTDNVNFSNISGTTAQNYTPTQTAPGNYYFRRIANVSATNPGSIAVTAQDISNVAQLTIRPKPNGVLTGSMICEGDPTATLTFTSNLGTGPFSLIINGVTYNNVNTGVPFTVTAPATTTVYNLTKITDSYGCINP